jgi:hypothetical protein
MKCHRIGGYSSLPGQATRPPGFIDFESIAQRADGADPSNDKGSGAGYLEARGRSGHAVVVSFPAEGTVYLHYVQCYLLGLLPKFDAEISELPPYRCIMTGIRSSRFSHRLPGMSEVVPDRR